MQGADNEVQARPEPATSQSERLLRNTSCFQVLLGYMSKTGAAGNPRRPRSAAAPEEPVCETRGDQSLSLIKLTDYSTIQETVSEMLPFWMDDITITYSNILANEVSQTHL